MDIMDNPYFVWPVVGPVLMLLLLLVVLAILWYFRCPKMAKEAPYCNRIYLEPVKRQAIYISLGPVINGYQKYPPFEPWMAQYVPQDIYSQWVQWLQQKLKELPFDDSCLCCKICFYGCCCCCGPSGLKDFNQEIYSGFAEIVSESGIPAALKAEGITGITCCRSATTSLPWVDSSGQPYVTYGKHGPHPAGKPPGYSIVIKLAEPITWPPPGQQIIIYQPGTQPPPPQPYIHQPSPSPFVPTSAPPPYNESAPEYKGHQFCISCGGQLVEGSKFCGKCGTAVSL